jgi:hypothetical protein
MVFSLFLFLLLLLISILKDFICNKTILSYSSWTKRMRGYGLN